MKILLVVLAVVLGLVLLASLGLRMGPAPFPAFTKQEGRLASASVPEGLPVPAERFFREIYGDEVPVITSAVISGRATMRLGPVSFPARFRFTHDAGNGYRHYIEATWFGLPIMRVNEHYLDGRARLELPFGVVENKPKVDQGANLGLWSESMWLPAVFLTDERVRWEAVDDATAILVVPFGDEEQRFIVRFEPESGLVQLFEAMRYKGADATAKTLWLNEARAWGLLGGRLTLTVGSAIWLDEGTPWAVFTVDEVVYNVDIADYIRERGP